MTVDLRTARHSDKARHAGSITRVLYPGVRGAGVKFVGLGCSLEDWDRIAATMPESVRPSVRGAWSGAFERAAIAFYQARPAPGPKRDNTFGQRAAEIRAALRGGPLSLTELAAVVNRSCESVRGTLHSLQAGGDVAAVSVVVRQMRQYRYQLRPGASRSGAPHTINRETRQGPL